MKILDDTPMLEYIPKNRPGERDNPNNYKSGQRKLLISEMEFLTKYSHLSDTLIYAGSSPGHHIDIIIRSFPNIKRWILYDPYETVLTPQNNIEIYKKCFSIDIAKQYKDLNALFISDIRSYDRSISKPDIKFADLIIQSDMELQKEWVENGNFVMSSLKFRLPWNLGTSTKYFDGDLHTQSWTGEYSPELRLFTDGKLYKIYNHKKIDNQMYWYNTVKRSKENYDRLHEYEVIQEYMKQIKKVKEGLDRSIDFFINVYCERFKSKYRN